MILRMILQAENIACRRGERLLFEGVNFQLQAGELLLLEGRNGCGKTTLLRTLAMLRQSDAGRIQWNNQPITTLAERYLNQLTWMGHHNALKGDLSAVENLQIRCRLHDGVCSDTAIWQVLDTMGLYGYEDLPTRVLSQGQKRRASLAYLLLSQAPLWILDEPFSALDSVAVDLLQTIIKKHIDQGGMLILTTHQEVALTSHINRLRLDVA